MKHGVRLHIAGARVSRAIVVALCVTALSTCSTGLLDLLAFQVLSDESAMLYLGYEEEGYGVARVGATTGAIEIFRKTVSPNNVNGCAVSIDPRPITTSAPWPQIHYVVESPNRIMRTDYSGLGSPEQAYSAGSFDRVTCVQVLEDGLYLAVFWSTSSVLTCARVVGGVAPRPFTTVSYIASFDVAPGTFRVYYLGLEEYEDETGYGIDGIDFSGSNHTKIVTIGHYVESNVLLQNGYLYYVTQNPSGIFRIKADGTDLFIPTLLLTPTQNPYAVAVDPDSGVLYWVEYGDTSPRIMRAAPGQTAGVPLLENLPNIDPNGFFFYRP